MRINGCARRKESKHGQGSFEVRRREEEFVHLQEQQQRQQVEFEQEQLRQEEVIPAEAARASPAA
jgi:hypothetical protein